jgi:hypothetical protein
MAQKFAESTLLRVANIVSLPQLQQLERKLLRQRSLRGSLSLESHGPAVRQLSIFGRYATDRDPETDDPVRYRQWCSALESIVVKLTALRVLVCVKIPLTYMIMTGVGRAAAHSLTSLSLWIDSSSPQSQSVLSCLAQFTQLVFVDIEVAPVMDRYGAHEPQVLDFRDEAPIRLVGVCKVVWQIAALSDYAAVLDYMALCRFHPKCILELRIGNATASDGTRLLPFFQSHQPYTFVLNCEGEELPALLFPHVMHLERVSISCGCVPHSLLDHGNLPGYLVLFIELWEVEWMEQFWTFLETMVARSASLPAQAQLGVVWSEYVDNHEYEYGSRFSWFDTFDPKELECEFMDRLKKHAVALWEKGIFIVDKDMRDVMCLSY